MEQDALMNDEGYRYFMRPEPKAGEMGPIETDEETGRRHRKVWVGMVRNARPETKRELDVWLDPLPHVVIPNAKALQGWYKSKVEPPGVRPRPCFTEAVLTEPYGGYCTVGCAFCYINSGVRGYRGSGIITVPKDYGAQVERQLNRLRTATAGYFSSFTDPFLPLEDVYHNSQQGAEAFDRAGLPVFFLSRLRYPDWAVALLRKNPYSYAQKSINTPDPEDWKKLSPAALPLEDHFEDITRLRSEGIYISIQVNPVIPGITPHEEVEQLFEKLAAAGAHHVIVKFVEASHSWVPTMNKRIERRFGVNRAAEFRELFVDNIGGQKTIAEEYRLEGHQRYRKKATQCGLTYATCYEYRYERDDEGNIKSKTGVSVGREFLTADQCHGHRVPMFTRQTTDTIFLPVPECPPTGCLVCADENEGKPRCGSETFGAAKALRTTDLKEPVK